MHSLVLQRDAKGWYQFPHKRAKMWMYLTGNTGRYDLHATPLRRLRRGRGVRRKLFGLSWRIVFLASAEEEEEGE